MRFNGTFQRLLSILAIVVPASTLVAQPRSFAYVHAQFGSIGGIGAAKLSQGFHLPSSPNELFQFLLEYFLKQKLGNTLPLNLDASHTYPTLENAQLPGGPFQGKPVVPTPMNLHAALAPGDYLVPVMAFCTQYSVHRPGEGTAYKLAPVEGTEAAAISALLWRGTLAGESPRELQAANWAVQASVPLDSMPKSYQALIDQLIPEYRNALRGNMLDVIQSSYREITTDPRKALQIYIREKYNKTIPVMLLPKIAVAAPPLEAVLAKLGAPGLLLLDAKKQSDILLATYTTKERGEELLFEGQGKQLPPEPASEGPWTVRIPGQAYMRFVIKGGNMQGNNVMQIRILPALATTQPPSSPPTLKFASLISPATRPVTIPPATSGQALPSTSVDGLLGVMTPESSNSLSGVQSLTSSGVIGYAVGGIGSQALIAVANPVPPARKPSATLTVLIHNGVTFRTTPSGELPLVASGLCMYVGAKIIDPDHAYPHYRWIQKVTEGLVKPDETSDFVDTYLGSKPGVASDQHLWYFRNPAYDTAWSQAGEQLPQRYDLLFRDMPTRPLTEPRSSSWKATTELVGVNADGTFDESAALGTVTWGFTRIAPGPLHPTPVTVDGAPWEGPPIITGLEATYLYDPGAIDRADPSGNHDLPLNPSNAPVNYKRSPLYRFLP